MTSDQLLADLGARVGLADVTFDGNRTCRLQFDGTLQVDFESPEPGSHIYIYSVIGPIPAQSPASFYESLLEANVPGDGHSGATTAIDSTSREVLLTQAFTVAATTADELQAALERFLTELETWREWHRTSAHAIHGEAEGDDRPAAFVPV